MNHADTRAPRVRRGLRAAAAVVAAIVALVFATVGDGVDVQATGLAGTIATHGHTAVWVLLAAALGVAALLDRWQRLSASLALAALVLYLAFLVVVLGH